MYYEIPKFNTWKQGKTGERFPAREFDQTRKVREFYLKYWKNQDSLVLENWKKNTEKVSKICLCEIVEIMLIICIYIASCRTISRTMTRQCLYSKMTPITNILVSAHFLVTNGSVHIII